MTIGSVQYVSIISVPIMDGNRRWNETEGDSLLPVIKRESSLETCVLCGEYNIRIMLLCLSTKNWQPSSESASCRGCWLRLCKEIDELEERVHSLHRPVQELPDLLRSLDRRAMATAERKLVLSGPQLRRPRGIVVRSARSRTWSKRARCPSTTSMWSWWLGRC